MKFQIKATVELTFPKIFSFYISAFSHRLTFIYCQPFFSGKFAERRADCYYGDNGY